MRILIRTHYPVGCGLAAGRSVGSCVLCTHHSRKSPTLSLSMVVVVACAYPFHCRACARTLLNRTDRPVRIVPFVRVHAPISYNKMFIPFACVSVISITHRHRHVFIWLNDLALTRELRPVDGYVHTNEFDTRDDRKHTDGSRDDDQYARTVCRTSRKWVSTYGSSFGLRFVWNRTANNALHVQSPMPGMSLRTVYPIIVAYTYECGVFIRLMCWCWSSTDCAVRSKGALLDGRNDIRQSERAQNDESIDICPIAQKFPQCRVERRNRIGYMRFIRLFQNCRSSYRRFFLLEHFVEIWLLIWS